MDDNARLILVHAKKKVRWEDFPDGPPADTSVAALEKEFYERLHGDTEKPA